jgi:hypothetical protein
MEEVEKLRLARSIRRYSRDEDLDLDDNSVQDLLDELEKDGE